MKWFVIYIFVLTTRFHATHGQKTFLDSPALRPFFRIMRNIHLNALSYQSDEEILRICKKRNLLQQQYDEKQKFFCDLKYGGRSKEVPTSVHRLTLGDIDVIASMGDSLTAGVGALALDSFQLTLENKGVSFSIGGEKDWRTFLTIPNLLKVYNQNLYGYSTGLRGLSTHKSSGFNVAELGAISRDTPHMAKVLIQRMRADKRVDIEKHWKFITILIGANDFCLDMCYQDIPEKIVKMHENDLVTVLRTLRDNLPRTIVNVLHPPNVMLLLKFKKKKPECETFHHFECPCVFGSQFKHYQKRYVKIIEDWKQKLFEVVNRDEFNNDNFTVNLQGFITNLEFPLTSDGTATDFTYMSTDCFHLSQKGYSLATNALWNNLHERNGNKTDNWNWKQQPYKFLCPTEEHPFIFTRENS